MLRSLKLLIALLFSLIVLMIYKVASGNSGNIGVWFLPITLGIIIIPLAYFIFNALKGKY
jgi:hypothetical protein